MSQAPSPFSKGNPNLQVVWDSTSLKALQFCARNYQYTILQGWRGSAVDLEFGIYFASAAETYKKARLGGVSKEEAQLLALRRVVEDSWLHTGNTTCDKLGADQWSCSKDECNCHLLGGQPWGGEYLDQWRCKGEKPYKNSKGNKAKCPWSHKGKWHPAPAPHTCGECGSETETVRRYLPVHTSKNRHTLVRLVAWYIEEQPENIGEGGLYPYKFPNGQPAVELSFKLPLPWKTPHGEPYILSGHIDSIMTTGEEHFIADNKTTAKGLTKRYWAGFSPNTQVDTYDIAGNLLYPELGLRGVVIEAAQTTTDGARFASQQFYRTDAQREEYLNELEWWLRQAERFAETGYYPMNRVNCWLCQFNNICNKEPAKREMFLKADFEKKPWNPLEER